MVNRYDVFLSHATPDKPAVRVLAQRLQDEGLVPFLDEWNLIPGDPLQEALEDALDNSRSCVICIGPDKIGPWQNEEMRSALEDRVRGREGFRVVPLMLPGATPPGDRELPRFLRRLLWVDFSAGMDDDTAFQRLLAGIRGHAPGPGGVASTPPPPTTTPINFSGRQKLAVCDRLGNSWSRLAMMLEIPDHDQARFSQGDEGRRIWEWLANRGQLGKLPGALEDIGRGDLADILKA